MKKVMGLKDIVLINVTAIIGIRWIPIAASYGASAITLWILAALVFFIPLGVVSTELATAWPEEGGLYVWSRYAFGEKFAFMVSWFYWINGFFYLPSLLTFMAVTLVFIFNPNLAQNRIYIDAIVLGSLWIFTLLNFRSIKVLKWITNFSGIFGTLLPGVIIILLGFLAAFFWKIPVPTHYSFGKLMPDFSTGSNIVFLTTLMFSMAGIELTPIIAGETKDPQKTFLRSLFISAILIVGIYIIATVAVTLMISPNEIGAASGIMDALKLITTKLHIEPLLIITAILITLGNIGGLSIWVVIPIKMFFESVREGLLPKPFLKLNAHDMPANAMLVQAVLVSIIVIFTSLLPSVNEFYETLVLMATITYFIPYLIMFVAFLRLRKTYPEKIRPYRVPGGKPFAWIIAMFGFCAVLLAIVLPFFVPPADVRSGHEVAIYRFDMAFGPIFFGLLGYAIFAIHEYRKRKGLINS